MEALRAAAAQIAVAVETARLYEDARRHAEQLELVADVSKAIVSSIDLDQTLTLVAQNLVRLVNASLCQIALLEEDREGWYGAAASDLEDQWRHLHAERSQGATALCGRSTLPSRPPDCGSQAFPSTPSGSPER